MVKKGTHFPYRGHLSGRQARKKERLFPRFKKEGKKTRMEWREEWWRIFVNPSEVLSSSAFYKPTEISIG